MIYIPLLGRLSAREYTAVVFGFTLYSFETLLLVVIAFLPKALIKFFHDLSRLAFYRFAMGTSPDAPKSNEKLFHDKIRDAEDFNDLCELWGYTAEEHVVVSGRLHDSGKLSSMVPS
jgi:lysosomal acid lipase/cholesteryl ester hydrolase